MSGLPPTDRTPIVSIYFSITMVGSHLPVFIPQNSNTQDVVNYNTLWKSRVPQDIQHRQFLRCFFDLSNLQFVTLPLTFLHSVFWNVSSNVISLWQRQQQLWELSSSGYIIRCSIYHVQSSKPFWRFFEDTFLQWQCHFWYHWMILYV